MIGVQLTVFFMLQPFIDMYRLLIGNKFEILGISLVELFNIILMLYLLLIFLFNQYKQHEIKPLLLFTIYGLAVIIYLAFHCLNLLYFDTSIINGSTINIFREIYVVIRSYLLPVAFIYLLLYIEINKQLFLSAVKTLARIISTVIVITNFLNISFISYASQTGSIQQIQANFFDWFSGRSLESVALATSKGLFYSGNQIGLILFILFPIVIYIGVLEKKWINYLFIITHALAMLMVATKTAAIGSILILFVMIIMITFFSLLRKSIKKHYKSLITLACITLLICGLFRYSPAYRMTFVQPEESIRTEEEQQLEKEFQGVLDESVKVEKEPNPITFERYLLKTYYMYGINKEYIDLLPIQDNLAFWVSVVNDPTQRQTNFRDFKQRLAEVVLDKNKNPMDPWLGIGYTTNFPYIEKDIVSQNLWFGIIGTTLLVGPFLFLLIVCLILLFSRWRENFDLYHCVLFFSVCGGIGISLIAGHLFGFVFPMFIFSFILGQLFCSLRTASHITRQQQ